VSSGLRPAMAGSGLGSPKTPAVGVPARPDRQPP